MQIICRKPWNILKSKSLHHRLMRSNYLKIKKNFFVNCNSVEWFFKNSISLLGKCKTKANVENWMNVEGSKSGKFILNEKNNIWIYKTKRHSFQRNSLNFPFFYLSALNRVYLVWKEIFKQCFFSLLQTMKLIHAIMD